MMNLPRFLFRCSIFAFAPIAANAAGTYYNGSYQSPQARYNTQTYAQRAATGQVQQNSAYNRSPYATRTGNNGYASSYSSTRSMNGNRTMQQSSANRGQTAQSTRNVVSASKNGFWLNAGISHEVAQWQFEMKDSASILHYDNIGWNVLDVRGGYVFDLGNTKAQIDAGFKYGIQSGESTMVDDDVTNGGYIADYIYDEDGKTVVGYQIGHALSVGTSKDGNMFGFNMGFGLKDFFKWGNLKFTPSVGYRYLKYKLETSKNYGMSVDVSSVNGCFESNGEIQCDPILIFGTGVDYMGNLENATVAGRPGLNSYIQLPDGLVYKFVDTAGTYYYEQPDVSHSYDVEWSGPYLALDMDYLINQNNSVNGRVELGFPGYTATGDQPYRFDWQHPKSVEDKAGMFGAFHFGLGANWMTAITDSVSLSLGVTYDYYSVDGADANTYLNGNYYNDIFNARLDAWVENGGTLDTMLAPDVVDTDGSIIPMGDATAKAIKQLEVDCPGWVCKANGEIESFYKSLGVRVGINAKF